MLVYERKKPRKCPVWASPEIFRKMKGVVGITLFGVLYEIPVLPETLPYIALLKGERNPWRASGRTPVRRKRAELGQEGMRFIIQTLLHQVEETSVAGAAQLLAQEIRDKLEPLIRHKIHANIQEKKALPAPTQEREP